MLLHIVCLGAVVILQLDQAASTQCTSAGFDCYNNKECCSLDCVDGICAENELEDAKTSQPALAAPLEEYILNIPLNITTHKNFRLLPLFPNCGIQKLNPRRKRIIGGIPAREFDFPWLVKIYTRNTLRSSIYFEGAGTLINSRYVLTSASVIPVLNNGATRPRVLEHIYVGEAGGTNENDTDNKYFIEKIITHEDALVTNQRNNIALLRLDRPVQFGDRVKPICLPLADVGDIHSKDNLKMAGFGTTFPGSDDTSDFAHFIEMNVFLNEYCDRVYSTSLGRLGKHHICAGGNTIYKSAGICNNDYGDPLMMTEKINSGDVEYKVTTQLGIASNASYCTRQGFPTVFMNVVEYIYWILENIRA